jgi:hydrogenase expression/formation protein HypE
MKEILLGHGSGGKMSNNLIRDLFVRYFDNPVLARQTDAALLDMGTGKIAFTTDSYVIDPIFFPGGDIGKLAVCGTVNDIAVSGAEPLYLSVGFIIEEGLPMDDLTSIVKSMAEEAKSAGVKIVTGDTKVVNKGKCDKLFINTAGVGMLRDDKPSQKNEVRAGDKIIVNGYIGDHGVAVMSKREALSYDAGIQSDCASLNRMIQKVTDAFPVAFMRDATRGGVATVLVEIAKMEGLGIELDEDAIPVRENVRGMCEIFGFDPLYVANEGKVIMVVKPEHEKSVLQVLKNHPLGKNCMTIGTVVDDHKKKVVMHTGVGGKRIIDMLAGEQLPRIC